MSEAEQLSHEEALDIVRRLGSAFKFVDEVLTTEKNEHQITAIWGFNGSGLPTLANFASAAELCQFISDMRCRQSQQPDVRYYLHIFYGKRWHIQKGKRWKLLCGDDAVPIDGGATDPVVDDSGSLFERADLDQILPTNTELQPAQEEAHDVQVRPQVLGHGHGQHGYGADDDEVAPAGRDPEVV